MPTTKVPEMMCAATRQNYKGGPNLIWNPMSLSSGLPHLARPPLLSNSLNHSLSENSRISTAEGLRESNLSRGRGKRPNLEIASVGQANHFLLEYGIKQVKQHSFQKMFLFIFYIIVLRESYLFTSICISPTLYEAF